MPDLGAIKRTLRDTLGRVPGGRWLYGALVTPATWIFHEQRLRWLQESPSVSALPFLYRTFAVYCAFAPRLQGYIIGAEQLHRLASAVTRLLRLRDHARVEVEDKVFYLHLTDAHSLAVPTYLVTSWHLRVLREHLGPGDTFVDIGANHGSFSVAAARLVGPEGLVVAFEPQGHLAELLRRSLGEAGVPFSVHEVACSDRNGEAEFFVPRASSGFAGLIRGYSGDAEGSTLRVPLRRFDDAVDWAAFPGKIFIKVDVEGAEAAVLRGAAGVLAARRPCILMEVNPEAAAAGGWSYEELATWLRTLGYTTAQRVGSDEGGPLEDLRWVDGGEGDVLLS